MKCILIIEDDELICKHLVKKAKQVNYKVKILTAKSDVEVLNIVKSQKIDAFFIDIQLINSNGLELAKELRTIKKYEFVPMVFITGVPTRELEAFKQVHSYDYILKPFTDEQITKVFKSILKDYFDSMNSLDKIVLEFKNYNQMLTQSDITYIEYKARKLYIMTSTEEIPYKHQSLKVFMDDLNNNFIQVHQSIIVNINVIKKYDFNESILILKSGIKVPVGRSYKKIVAKIKVIPTW